MIKNSIKNVFRIYKNDMRKVISNWVAIVILLGLSLLPSLYAWVNIGASWDPYSNTSGIKVGIVDLDKGSSIRGKTIEIGQNIENSLKGNNKLGWVFFDNEDSGKAAVEEGNVYATIIIPEDFSHDISTVLDSQPVKPKLEYYVNEKINAIAPKMTDSGVTTIQKQITSSFVDTAIKEVFEIFNQLGVELNNYYPQIEKYKVKLFELDEKFPTLYDKFDKIISTANNGLVQLDSKNQDVNDMQEVLEELTNFMDDINKTFSTANENVTNNEPQIRENMALIESILSNTSKTTKELEENTVTNKPEVINDLNNSIDDLSQLKNKLDSTATKIEQTGIDISGEIKEKTNSISNTIKDDEELLKKLKENITNGQADTNAILANLISTSDSLATQINDLNVLVDNSFDSTDKTLKSMETVCDNIDSILVLLPSQTDSIKTQINNLINTTQNQIKNLQDKYPSVPLGELSKTLESIQQSLNNSTTEQQIQDLIKNLTNLNTQSKKSISNLDKDLEKQKIAIDNNLSQMAETTKTVSRVCTNLQNTINSNLPDIIKKLDSTISNLGKADTEIKSYSETLSSTISNDSTTIGYDIKNISPKLDELKNILTDLRNKVQNHDNVEQLLSDLNELTFNMDTSIQKIIANLDGNILPTIESYLKSSAKFALDMKNIISDTNKDLDQFKNLLDSIKKNGTITVDELNNIKSKVPNVQKNLDTITEKIKEFEKTSSLEDIINTLTKDGNTEGDFISQPVELNSHKIYPIANYGSAMTPFYSTLSLWVGALILTALLTTKAKNANFEVTPKEEFFGKYLFFSTFAALQGLIVCLGDIFFLGVKASQSGLLVFLGVFCSLVFSMIVYSLVSVFGNVGKATGVVFMVIQLAGSGGTFPIEVTPNFFQIVYSLLPFTYAISAMREAIGGVVFSTLLKDFGVLIGYFLLFMIIGITLKKWVNKILNVLNHKLGESGVVEH
ncbi:YhgE/Pip domain-containing protein [Clostridium sp. SHJSY1]|uniref:YhgE/Pip domain-containing protein n=1 Tax=Clostridium sp. SHJSY1 TaxID=2942483 RepID=UPI0028757E2F|nr:YhgE/Pip domain-containing protein [Clostridium sp. SHJSY1]MDS0524057.1 YhgE/Pip domain-containing protein [Clostridium sp. SHJSY1]